MARKISLTNENWRLYGAKPCGNTEVDDIVVCFPASIEGALERAGVIDSHEENGRACEWVNNRVWTTQAEFELPKEPPEALSEKHFLCVEEIFGEGKIVLNGAEVGHFGADVRDIFADVTGILNEGGANRIEITFNPNDISALEKIQRIYRGQSVPMLAPRGIGGIYIKSTSFGVIKSIKALNIGGKVSVTAAIDAANRGKYNFKYRVTQGGALAGSANITQSLMAARQSIKAEIPCGETGGGAALRLTLERGGIRCDFAENEIEFECEKPKRDLLRAVMWTPLSLNICDVTLDDYAYALMLLKNMGINAVVLNREVRERRLFFSACRRLSLAVLSEDDGLIEGAVEIDLSQGSFEQKIRRVRKTLAPILMRGMISPAGAKNYSTLFSSSIEPMLHYTQAAQALRPWILYMRKLRKKGEGPAGGIGSAIYEIFSICDSPAKQPVILEALFLDSLGSPLHRRNFTLIQSGRCISTGEFRVDTAALERAVAIDIKAHTALGIAAAYREVFGGFAAKKRGGTLQLANHSDESAVDVALIDGTAAAGVVTLYPQEHARLPMPGL